jgi:hypothetical protein
MANHGAIANQLHSQMRFPSVLVEPMEYFVLEELVVLQKSKP